MDRPEEASAPAQVARAAMIMYGLPNDPGVLAAVGKVAILHGQLEDCLRMTIKIIAELSPTEARHALDRTTTSEVRRRIVRLAKQRLGDGQPLLKIEALMRRAEILTERRKSTVRGATNWTVRPSCTNAVGLGRHRPQQSSSNSPTRFTNLRAR